MTLRFYPGGPHAMRGYAYWVTADWNSGCYVAHCAGAQIPWQTYDAADVMVSQERTADRRKGFNRTALLPIEV